MDVLHFIVRHLTGKLFCSLGAAWPEGRRSSFNIIIIYLIIYLIIFLFVCDSLACKIVRRMLWMLSSPCWTHCEVQLLIGSYVCSSGFSGCDPATSGWTIIRPPVCLLCSCSWAPSIPSHIGNYPDVLRWAVQDQMLIFLWQPSVSPINTCRSKLGLCSTKTRVKQSNKDVNTWLACLIKSNC